MHGDDKIGHDFELYPSMTIRPTALAALAAIIISTLLALLLQLGLLGALGWGLGNVANELPLVAGANVRDANVGETKGLRFDPTRGAAVAQAANFLLPANNALGLILHTEDVSPGLRLTLGWLSTLDLRRPATTNVSLPSNADLQQSVVLLTGHPQWRERVTRMGLAVERTNRTESATVSALLARAEWLPASPLGGMRLLSTAWFSPAGNIITPNESASRLLPLALWLALIAACSLLLVAMLFRKKPEQRAEALQLSVGLLVAASVVLTVLANRWPGWTVPLGAGMAAALALLLLARSVALPQLPLTAAQRTALAALALGVAWMLAPLVSAVAMVPGLVIWLGSSQSTLSSRMPASTMRVIVLLAALPMLLLAAVAQGMIPAPSLLKPLVDPTGTLSTVATASGGLPGLALGVLMTHQLWPASAASTRWSSSGAAALMWAMTGALAVLTIPKIAALAAGSSTYIAVFFPALICLLLAAWPKFQSIAKTAAETVAVEAKSEQDLSTQALALLQSHGERVQATLLRGESGAAHAALAQMQRIAPAARATTLARLRVTLFEGDLVSAEAVATALQHSEPLATEERDALLDLAHRSNQQTRVLALAPGASLTERNQRMLAIAQLGTEGPGAALQTLTAWPDEHCFAAEIAELHLLGDDVAAAQMALVNSGIALDEPAGQAYIARLGMRVEGPQGHAQEISRMATYNPQLGVAQAALGELLQRTGNATGARARLLLAVKLDLALWPLHHRIAQLEQTLQGAATRSAATASGTDVQKNASTPTT